MASSSRSFAVRCVSVTTCRSVFLCSCCGRFPCFRAAKKHAQTWVGRRDRFTGAMRVTGSTAFCCAAAHGTLGRDTNLDEPPAGWMASVTPRSCLTKDRRRLLRRVPDTRQPEKLWQGAYGVVVGIVGSSTRFAEALYRTFEVLAPSIAPIEALPIMLIEAALVRWDLPAPIFFNARPGR
jgi:hypothetical protein